MLYFLKNLKMKRSFMGRVVWVRKEEAKKGRIDIAKTIKITQKF